MWARRVAAAMRCHLPGVHRRLYNDLSNEIREHMEPKKEELVAEGPEKKPRPPIAPLEIQEQSREVWQWPSIENFVRIFAASYEYFARMQPSPLLPYSR